MSDIEFEADVQDSQGVNHYSNRSGTVSSGASSGYNPYAQSGTSNIGMVRWMINHGLISSEGGAKFILYGIVAINFTATALILYFYVFR